MTYILYNPIAGNGSGKEKAETVRQRLGAENAECLDITALDTARFLSGLDAEEKIIIAGGDGTLNRLMNALGGQMPKQKLYYYAAGSGNDFMNDVSAAAKDGMVELNGYMRSLPVAEVNGQKHYFINGVGYGIDGYCCQTGDELCARGERDINYTGIAIKGLLKEYKPTSAAVTVDGREYKFRHVWLAPTMVGRYYGGGMMVAPAQDRLNGAHTVSVVVLHCKSKLKTLVVFPNIFSGQHVKHTDMVQVITGHDIRVRFDRPTPLQIDGETIKDVTEYSVRW